MTGRADRPTIVTLTPLALTADSRTLKQAISVARFGYRSVVIEGVASAMSGTRSAIEVLSVEDAVRRTPPPSGRPNAFRRLAYIGRRFAGFVGGLTRIVRIAPKADLYYLHAFYQFPAVFVLCLRHRAKMIYDAHDFYGRMSDGGALSAFQRLVALPAEGLIERACVRCADAVLTVNEGIAALLKNRFGCDARILRNFHDRRLDVAPRQTIRETLGLPAGAFLVVSIGNWKAGMAIDQMFEAMAGLPCEVHLAFLGKGYPDLSAAVAARGLTGRVHVVPAVLPQEVVPYIATADASVVLYYGKSINDQNALPNRFFQAIAAELPLLYPDLLEMRRVAERHSIGTMVDPRAPAQIAAALRRLIEDPQARAAMRARSRIAANALSWANEEIALRGILESSLGAPVPASRAPASA
ncbi:MAG: glycosyltransferase [Azospirillum sp.]|nr:glycosyltransferase [Azospirillum sp.]